MTARLVYSVEEAAELLGCSVDHVMRWIRHDHLVAFLDAREIASPNRPA